MPNKTDEKKEECFFLVLSSTGVYKALMAEFVSLNISWISVLETSWCLLSNYLVKLLFWLWKALDKNMYNTYAYNLLMSQHLMELTEL
jgi:hypothetical protein